MALPLIAVSLSAQENAELERHIKAGQLVFSIEFGAAEIMDTIRAFFDQLDDLLDARPAAIVDLQRAADHKPASSNSKNDCFKVRFIFVVEWTVDENVERRDARFGH